MNSHTQLRPFTTQFLRPMKALWFHQREEERHGWLAGLTQRRIERKGLLERIKLCAEPWQPGYHVYGHEDYTGPVIGVKVWSRDCDHVCGENRYFIPATVKAYDEFVDRQLDWAEGPMTFSVCRPSLPFRAWSRDMVLEAYEDGHPHAVADAHRPVEPVPESVDECEFGYDEYQWRLKQAGL